MTLDTRGNLPTPAEIEVFRADRRPGRRLRVIDRLLDDPGWADHWVSYWQDVLAENPNLLNRLSTTPVHFRYWLHESFFDNKPMDRFATELIMMRGSKHFGGPAGFGLATQNDVPMAAKANIVGQAFLGLEMKCARCHDAPSHPFEQRDLFSLAAMLKRSPQAVPKSSSINATKEELSRMHVSVTLKLAKARPGVAVRGPSRRRTPKELVAESEGLA